ncbi:MAG TPA: TetR/AcrR family transcriptional regulator [Pseudonocardiaceae bacterium]|nr:TetR/AcrR family transcriptional regulator [Pseudonocardiaceae bacterium]
MVQEGSLARTHGAAPGLPRGRSSLPQSAVRAAQRERLLAAAVAAVAEHGFHALTVAEIVRRAKVSRAAFYVHFSDKENCFLSATAHGGSLLFDAVLAATRELPPGASPEDQLRAGTRAFLGFLAGEPAFARVFYVDMPAAGPHAVARMDVAQHRFAELNRAWHERALRWRPDWPDVPYDAYLGLSGATTELVSVRVRHGKTAELPELEDTLVALHLAVLAGQVWPAEQVRRTVVDGAGGEP